MDKFARHGGATPYIPGKDIKRRLGRNLDLKGDGEMEKSINSSGFAVANTMKPRTIPKKGSEPSYYEELCKEAGFWGELGQHVPKITALGALGLGTLNAVNSGEGLAPSFLQMAVMAPVAGWAAAHGRNIYGKARAAGKATEYLTKDLTPEQISAGMNTLGLQRSHILGQQELSKAYRHYENLGNRIAAGHQLSAEEKAMHGALHDQFSEMAFNQKYGGGLLNRAKGMGIRIASKFDPNVAKDLASGAYAPTAKYMEGQVRGAEAFVNQSQNRLANMEHLKNKNVDLQEFTKNTINRNQDIDKVLDMHPEDFQKHRSVLESMPRYKPSPFEKTKNFFAPPNPPTDEESKIKQIFKGMPPLGPTQKNQFGFQINKAAGLCKKY